MDSAKQVPQPQAAFALGLIVPSPGTEPFAVSESEVLEHGETTSVEVSQDPGKLGLFQHRNHRNNREILKRLNMGRTLRSTIAIFAVAIIATSCSLFRQVPATELEQIIRRDRVPFEARRIPGEVIDQLASHRVVLVGETHILQEHRELMADLLRELHAKGFRQFLFEWCKLSAPIGQKHGVK